MKTIGKALKEARLEKDLTIEAVGRETKIKRKFILALENESWHLLPEFPVTLGFIKNIASVVGLDRTQAVALARRDYPPKALPITPKKDVSDRFVWSPRMTFIAIASFLGLLVVGYLVLQYVQFTSPPPLEVYKPREGDIMEKLVVEIAGKTDSEATVKVNNQPILVDDKGIFMGEVEVSQTTSEVEIISTSRSGKSTTVKRTISVKPK